MLGDITLDKARGNLICALVFYFYFLLFLFYVIFSFWSTQKFTLIVLCCVTVPAGRVTAGHRKWPGACAGMGRTLWWWCSAAADTGETGESYNQDAGQVRDKEKEGEWVYEWLSSNSPLCSWTCVSQMECDDLWSAHQTGSSNRKGGGPIRLPPTGDLQMQKYIRNIKKWT